MHANYEGAPNDGSAWIAQGECNNRVIRGGSFVGYPVGLRSALRFWFGGERTRVRGVMAEGSQIGAALMTVAHVTTS